MSYKTEFPHFGEIEVEIPDGFEDVSWQNDAYPCFADSKRRLFLWIANRDSAQRELETARFMIERGGQVIDGSLQHGLSRGADLLETEEWSEVIDFLAKFDVEHSTPNRP